MLLYQCEGQYFRRSLVSDIRELWIFDTITFFKDILHFNGFYLKRDINGLKYWRDEAGQDNLTEADEISSVNN